MLKVKNESNTQPPIILPRYKQQFHQHNTADFSIGFGFLAIIADKRLIGEALNGLTASTQA
jgi:hypothetical protein